MSQFWDTYSFQKRNTCLKFETRIDAEEEDEPMEEAYGERNGGNATSTSGKYGGAYGATGTDTGNAQLHEGFKSRLQKLANIKK